jgi:penicillin amidase
MRPAVVVVVSLGLAISFAGCKDVEDSPFGAVPLDGDFDLDVSAPVHVLRDEFGIAHIDAETLADAAYVQGYVMAHDRLPQMDILRRFGAGTLAELFGSLDPSIIDTDLEMRVHRMRPLAEEAWTQLQASSDPLDREVVVLLQRFSDGVNAYAESIRTEEEGSTGVWVLDPNILASFDPIRFEAWSPVDSLVLGRFQAFALSWTTPFELDATELYQGLRDKFEGAPPNTPEGDRDGITRDILKFTPIGDVPTIDGFPNVGNDTGSRSDGSTGSQRTQPVAAVASGVKQPKIPRDAFARARTFFARGPHDGPLGALGPHAFMAPYAGSNNWAVGPGLTTTGTAMLATDQHLQLPNPSIFYPTHLRIRELHVESDTDADPAPLDLVGITFPGIPGVILGTNGHVAWSGTVSYHDVNDIYLETITGCAQGACVDFQGTQVPIETFTESIEVGALGLPTQAPITATYEMVPHHGPLIPEIDDVNHRVVPRTASSAFSVKYTGYTPTFEIRALWQLGRGAIDVDDAFRALAHFSYGSQNWTMIDRKDNVAWTTNAVVPERDAAAYQWNVDANPDGLAPFFVLPGDGTAEWTGRVASRYVPHAILRPGEASSVPFIATANADPVGASFDGDPLNQPSVDGHSLYVGLTYAAGVRQERIVDRLVELGNTVTVDGLASIQHDTYSMMGAKLAPHIVTTLTEAQSSAIPEVAAYVAALDAADRARLDRARTLLGAWTYRTPTGLADDESTPNGDPDSAATAVFNAWMHFFIKATLDDEITAATGGSLTAFSLDDNFLARIVYALIDSPNTFVQGDSGQPVICDAMASPTNDSCSYQIIAAVLASMHHWESAMGFATDDVTKWAWGDKHRLTIQPLFPNTALDLTKPDRRGFPKTGDNFVVNRSDQGWDDLDFSQDADGPAQRFIAISRGRDLPLEVRWALPGGVIYDSRSPHYRDLLDKYYLEETHFKAEYDDYEKLVPLGESRWIFR